MARGVGMAHIITQVPPLGIAAATLALRLVNPTGANRLESYRMTAVTT